MDELTTILRQLQGELLEHYCYRDKRLDRAVTALDHGDVTTAEQLFNQLASEYSQADWPLVSVPLMHSLRELHALAPHAA